MEWKTIQGYEQYEVSNEGQVRNRKTGKILKQWKDKGGYLLVTLFRNGKQKWYLVHRLVAQAFIPNPNNLATVNHIDHNKENNSVSNLEWMSLEDNIRDGKNKKVYCVELDQTFDSIREAERETGINNASISQCCKGRLKTAGKMHWKYVES